MTFPAAGRDMRAWLPPPLPRTAFPARLAGPVTVGRPAPGFTGSIQRHMAARAGKRAPCPQIDDRVPLSVGEGKSVTLTTNGSAAAGTFLQAVTRRNIAGCLQQDWQEF